MTSTLTKAPELHTAAAHQTPTDLGDGVAEVSVILGHLLDDVFALYLKTRNYLWHMGEPHFRDYQLLLDEQAEQIFALTEVIAERARKIGGLALRSIGYIARYQRLAGDDYPQMGG